MSATWYKDDVPVPNCEDFAYVDGKNGEFSLLINDPFSADSGIYSCKVINTFGEAVSHGQLVINGLYKTYKSYSLVLALSCNFEFKIAHYQSNT